EVLIDIGIVVEAVNEHLVLGIGGFDHRQGRGVHSLYLVAHAPAVIDDQTHRYWDVFPAKIADLLVDAILCDLEARLWQACNQLPPFIDHTDMQEHAASIASENGDVLIGGRLRRYGQLDGAALSQQQSASHGAGYRGDQYRPGDCSRSLSAIELVHSS